MRLLIVRLLHEGNEEERRLIKFELKSRGKRCERIITGTSGAGAQSGARGIGLSRASNVRGCELSKWRRKSGLDRYR
jgi:hypothetical protein